MTEESKDKKSQGEDAPQDANVDNSSEKSTKKSDKNDGKKKDTDSKDKSDDTKNTDNGNNNGDVDQKDGSDDSDDNQNPDDTKDDGNEDDAGNSDGNGEDDPGKSGDESDKSPKVVTEYKSLGVPVVPEEEKDDVIWTFKFDIKNKGSKSDVSFTLELNPSLDRSTQNVSTKMSSLQPANADDSDADKESNDNQPVNKPDSKPPVINYTFKDGTCNFVHLDQSGWYIKGNIDIVQTSMGQFSNNKKNFDFDLEFGKTDSPPHEVLGLFQLEDMGKKDSE